MSTATAPPLTTGWEPDLPDGDTLCLRWVRHWSDQCAAFAAAAGGTVVRDERFVMADYGRPASFFNAAVLLAPQPGRRELDALLDEIESRAAGGQGDLYLWSLWPTPDLRNRGWVLDGHPPLLVRPSGTTPPTLHDVERPEPVRTAAALADWERVLVEGYPVPDLRGSRSGAVVDPALLDDPRLRFWTTFAAGTPVSISAQFVAHGVAGFALGVTMPAARRAGHWSRHARWRLATEPGLGHVGVFSDDSRPGAEQLGFVPVIRHTLWHRTRRTPS
jgi:hypothetical protein